jgi:ABC-type antimicrobial peptide transport system permease subunit
MLRSYLTIALRVLWRSKGYTIVNVAGIATAFCICLFLFLTAYLHLTYDSFHRDIGRIFQTYFFANDPDQASKTGAMPLPLAPALKAEMPELEAATRVLSSKGVVEYQGKCLDKHFTFVDPDFFTLFSFPMREGNEKMALNGLSDVVLSENMAGDLFGAEDPVGKSIRISTDGVAKEYVVTGVISDAPDNSTIRYDALMRIENMPAYATNQANWGATSHMVFVKTIPQAKPTTLEKRLKAFTQKYFPDKLTELKGKGARPDTQGDVFALRLQKLTDVHFDGESSDRKGTPIAVIYVLLGMGFFILLIASINFVNLTIARSLTRAREVGVRKSLGAIRSSLFVQLWGESAIVCFFGLMLGAGLAYVLLPEFNAVFGAKLRLTYILQPGFLGFIGSVFLLVTLIAGGYPAWKMATFDTVHVLKGQVSLKRPGVLRNSLIVTQFSLACLLTCCTIIAFQQVEHLRAQPLGFDKEQVISIPVGNHVNGRQVLQRMRNKLANDPGVVSLTGTSVNIGRGRDRTSTRTTLGFTSKGKSVEVDMLLVDYDYLKTLKIQPAAGRDFDRVYATDSLNRVIVTQSMAKLIGEPNPVGALLGDDDDTSSTKAQIIGVIPDFQLYSVAEQSRPITLHISHSEPIRYIFVRVSEQSLAGAMDKLRKVWKEVAPQSEFMGSFLNENVDEWYNNEEQLFQIFSLASGIAILLTCIGLFAIALLLIEQRTKEIGIRKVLGANVFGLVVLLSRQFVKLVLIGLIIAIPLAWFGMQQWLVNYPYRIEISLWVFVLVGFGAMTVALLSVSFQTVKAALRNPVKSLRSE